MRSRIGIQAEFDALVKKFIKIKGKTAYRHRKKFDFKAFRENLSNFFLKSP